nr:putative multiple coagulation factor deficiency protein 2 isoform X3 [Biomphalaria glabrata]
MAMHLAVAVLLVCLVHHSTQQPPGVPPKQQGHGHNQHQQQPPQHHQQQQQPPQQDGHGHGGGHGHEGGHGLEFASEVHNADHILEHLEKVVATKSKEQMTEEELEFHYFKLHDYDNNNKLDGVEIGKALTHFHEESNSTEEVPATKTLEEKNEEEKVLSENIESILLKFDSNADGYIDYFEFRKVALQSRSEQKSQS